MNKLIKKNLNKVIYLVVYAKTHKKIVNDVTINYRLIQLDSMFITARFNVSEHWYLFSQKIASAAAPRHGLLATLTLKSNHL